MRVDHRHLAIRIVALLTTIQLSGMTSAQLDSVGDHPPVLSPLLRTETGDPIATPQQWAARRAAIERDWTERLGSVVMDQPPPRLVVVERDRLEGVVRTLVRYQAEPGIEVEAYLLRPDSAAPPASRPGVLVLHPTTGRTIREPAGVDGDGPRAFALDLARRGLVAFCPTNFLWVGPGSDDTGGYRARTEAIQGRHAGATGMAKMLYDARRALDALAAEPDVDPERLGAIGHSLGAKETLYLAAFDGRVAAAVFHEGGLGLSMSNWHDVWYLGDRVQGNGLAHDHHELLALIAPRPFLVMGGGSADGPADRAYIEAARTVYRLIDAEDRLQLILHDGGHEVTPFVAETSARWLISNLSHDDPSR